MTIALDEPADGNAELTADHEAELEAAIAAADRGEGVPWEIVRNELRA